MNEWMNEKGPMFLVEERVGIGGPEDPLHDVRQRPSDPGAPPRHVRVERLCEPLRARTHGAEDLGEFPLEPAAVAILVLVRILVADAQPAVWCPVEPRGEQIIDPVALQVELLVLHKAEALAIEL